MDDLPDGVLVVDAEGLGLFGRGEGDPGIIGLRLRLTIGAAEKVVQIGLGVAYGGGGHEDAHGILLGGIGGQMRGGRR